jgi:hypothetical protein
MIVLDFPITLNVHGLVGFNKIKRRVMSCYQWRSVSVFASTVPLPFLGRLLNNHPLLLKFLFKCKIFNTCKF